MSDERQSCTPEHPYAPGGPGRWFHPDAQEIEQSSGWPSGDVVTYRCPNCGHVFDVELPQ